MLKNLKLLREEARVSQKQLAEAIGVSQQSINKYENHNIEPDIETMTRMADYFRTSVDYLVGHTDIRRRIEATSPKELNEAEARLLEGYRGLSETRQRSLQQIIDCYNE